MAYNYRVGGGGGTEDAEIIHHISCSLIPGW